VSRANINIFHDVFVAVTTTQVFTFGLQVSHGRTQTEVELVLRNHFEVLRFVSPTQGARASCVVGLGVLCGQIDVVGVIFQTTGVGFSAIAVTNISNAVLVVGTFGTGDCTTQTKAFAQIVSDRTAYAVAVLTQRFTTVVGLTFTGWATVFTLVLNSKVQTVNQA